MFDGCLTIAFPTPNYTYHKLGYIYPPHRAGLYNPRPPNRVSAVPPSPPFLLHADEGGKFSESTASSVGSMIGLDNTVGIIGGASVDSTLKFMRKLVQWGSKDELGYQNLPIVLCSDPVLSKNLLTHERSFLPALGGNKINRTQFNPSQIVESLRSKRVFLENSGARCVVMPCHVSHSWHKEVSEGSNVPLLHIGECVARQLKEAKLKPIEAGSPLRIGVLGTNATLNAGFYQEKLRDEGFEVVLPDKATMEHTVIPAISAISRKDIEGARNLLRIALQFLLVRAVNFVVLASDDMRDLLPPDDPLLKKCVDPMDALAWSTINWAQSTEKSV